MRVGLWSRLRPLRRGAERAGPSRGSAPISPGTPLPDPFPDLLAPQHLTGQRKPFLEHLERFEMTYFLLTAANGAWCTWRT